MRTNKAVPVEHKTRWFSESYTSLLLGVVVVIIATILLISFLKNQHIASVVKPTQDISYDRIGPTTTPTQNEYAVSSETPPITEIPSVTMNVTPISSQTPVITTTPSVTPTPIAAKPDMIGRAGTYTVKAGDDLWHIAQSHYNDGYKWVTIARANNLAEPNYIHVGDVLTLPALSESTQMTNHTEQGGNIRSISGNSYTVMKGDDLWDIAVRAYGDGYRWSDIAKANNLVNPSLIHSGNVLTIPR